MLSHYEVLEPLGAGGMGEVYRARDTRLNRDVAIKILPTDRPFSETARRRFQREALAASALNHPNIITIYEIDSQDNVDFIVMEYVRGSTLDSLLKKGSLTVHQTLCYAVQIADAVAKAHSSGIIHRDLKPGNVMVTDSGLVKVLDFGLAKFDSPTSQDSPDAGSAVADTTQLTMPGMTSGTLAYMSPEQARGDAVDARSDIFSFGSLLFQLLTGELPFSGQNYLSMLHNIHFNPPKELASLRPELPESLVALVSSMLEKDTAKRIQSMGEVAFQLRWIGRELDMSLSQEPGTLPTLDAFVPPRRVHPRWYQKRRVWVAAGLAVALAVIGIGGWVFFRRFPVTRHVSAPQSNQPEAAVEDTPYALYKSARDSLDHFDRRGATDRAIRLLQRAVQLDPKSAASYAALAEAYARKNASNPDPQWVKLASDSASRALELDSYLAEAHVSAGLAAMQRGRWDDAEKELQRASDLNPKSSIPHRWLGALYDKTQKLDRARKELQRAAALDPNDWKIYMEMGLNSYLGADYRSAATSWEQALKLEPDNVPALENLGAVYQMLERNDDAAAALQRALEIQPNAETYNNLGNLRFFQGRYSDSVAAFEKTVQLSANSYDSWGNLGDAYRWTPGDADKAKQAYRRAIDLIRGEISKNPGDLDLRATLASYLAKSGDKAEALRELAPVEHARKKEGLTWYRCAVVYELCGQRDKALQALLSAVKAGQSLRDIKNDPELTSLRADPRYHLEILDAAAGAGQSKK
jgi:eukaryotic-like serine/threonine-protein kinase